MNAHQGISRIIFVLHILGLIWLVFCLIEVVELIRAVLVGGVLHLEPSWAMLALFIPAFKWIGIAIAGIGSSQVVIWILEGFIDE
jgi:hypothetical protein